MPASFQLQKFIFDEANRKSTKKLTLKVQLSKTFLHASHFYSEHKQFISLYDYALGNHDSWLTAIQLIREAIIALKDQPIDAVSFALVDSLYTTVPIALFDPQKIGDYLSFNHTSVDLEEYEMNYNFIDSLKLVVVYAAPKLVLELLNEHFQNVSIYHYSLPLLEGVFLEKAESKLHLNIHDRRFDVIYKKENQLQFFNSFHYQSVEDFIYFLLYVMEQLQLDRETTKVEVSGEFEKNAPLYQTLYQYIREINIGKRPSSVNYSQRLNELPVHHYSSLFSQYLCE